MSFATLLTIHGGTIMSAIPARRLFLPVVSHRSRRGGRLAKGGGGGVQEKGGRIAATRQVFRQRDQRGGAIALRDEIHAAFSQGWIASSVAICSSVRSAIKA